MPEKCGGDGDSEAYPGNVETFHRLYNIASFRGFRNKVIWLWIDEIVDKKACRHGITT